MTVSVSLLCMCTKAGIIGYRSSLTPMIEKSSMDGWMDGRPPMEHQTNVLRNIVSSSSSSLLLTLQDHTAKSTSCHGILSTATFCYCHFGIVWEFFLTQSPHIKRVLPRDLLPAGSLFITFLICVSWFLRACPVQTSLRF